VRLSLAVGDAWHVGSALYILGQVARDQGDFAGAAARYEKVLATARAVDPWGAAVGLYLLGSVRVDQGDLAGAVALLDEALPVLLGAGDKVTAAKALESLARVAARRGDEALARERYRDSLTLFGEAGEQLYSIVSLEGWRASTSARGPRVRRGCWARRTPAAPPSAPPCRRLTVPSSTARSPRRAPPSATSDSRRRGRRADPYRWGRRSTRRSPLATRHNVVA